MKQIVISIPDVRVPKVKGAVDKIATKVTEKAVKKVLASEKGRVMLMEAFMKNLSGLKKEDCE